MSTTSCFAVGSYSDKTLAERTLVERWNGTKWSLVTSPNPSDATSSALSGVACLNATTCYAVGSYFADSTINSLVERWNGTSWSILASPPPSGATASFLRGVACPIAGSCYAVGQYSTGSGENALVERWNGTSWSPVASPILSGTAELDGVACLNASRCFAVGSYFGSSEKTLVERWNGTSWSIIASPNPSTYSFLSGVACPISGSCYAVGTYSAGGTDKTLVERWNGTSWSIVASPNPTGSGLRGVACASATSCYAVGDSFDGLADKTLVERWNGTSWSIVASPNPSGATGSFLSGVACPSTTSCYAVGSYRFAGGSLLTLVEHWNGTSWSIAAPPSGSSQSQLAQVTCPSATSCFAVGHYLDGSSVKTLVERWNATSWSIVTSRNPSGATDSVLSGVSCPSTTSCYAVGHSSASGTDKTLVEHWNGTSWSIVTSPNPSGATDSSLSGVACPSTTSCYAVGHSFFDGLGDETLVERWNGTSWSIVTSPNPSDATASFLSGVSCPSTTSCYAVGHSTALGSDKTLVERWNGTSWSIAAPPSGSTGGQLAQVSCPSATSCYAVGSYIAGPPGFKTLVERWNGTTWSIVTSPNSSDATDSVLSGVSCPSTTSCYAVGDSFDNVATFKTLVERWNGTTWSIVTSPNPSGATDSLLSGVSCPSTTNCYAVGDYDAHAGEYTLIERYA